MWFCIENEKIINLCNNNLEKDINIWINHLKFMRLGIR